MSWPESVIINQSNVFCQQSLHTLIAKPLLSEPEQMLLHRWMKIGNFLFICITNSQSKENSLVCITISNLILLNGFSSWKNKHVDDHVLPVLTYYHRRRTVEGWGQTVHLFRATAGHRADRGTSRGVGTFDRNHWKDNFFLKPPQNKISIKFITEFLHQPKCIEQIHCI